MMHGSKRLRLALLMPFALRVFAQTDHVQLQIARLQDADAVVRTVAVTALGQFRDARAVDPLLAALKDPDESVRMTTAYSLHGFRAAREVPALIAALDDSSETVSQAAAMTLGDLKDPRAIPALMNGLSTHRGNEFGLTQMGGAAVPALVGGLHSDDPTVRQRVAEVLGMIRDPRAETPLLAATHDPVAAVRAAVSVALSYFPDAGTADALLAASKDPDASVRGVVVRMMTRWKALAECRPGFPLRRSGAAVIPALLGVVQDCVPLLF